MESNCLIPKTLAAKTQNQHLTQRHDVELAMKTLQYEGFLRGPGLLQLETTQKCFATIKEKPQFQVHKFSIVEFCNQGKRIRVKNYINFIQVTNIGPLLSCMAS